MTSSNPVFCVLTPRGRAAVAAICVKGSTAIDIVQRHFAGAAGIPVLSCPGDAIVYGNWLPEGKKGEDLVVCTIARDEIEIYCHGGDAAANVIRHSLLSSGVREIPISEYAYHRANGPMEGELTLALTHAPTRKTARLLLAQQLPQHQLIASLRKCVAARDNERAIDMIDRTLDWKLFGRHLVEPWSVVVCGQPNVGKSSLINALVGFERAIVHPIAGTTRDILSQTTAVDGWPIELTDTAGLHDGDNDIERAGIRLALQRIPVADLVIAVFDASRTCADDDFLFINRINPGIVVVNKSDLKNEELTQFPGMPVSAKTGQGIQELIHRMAETLVPQLPPSGQAVPVSSQQLGFLEQAKSLIEGNRWADADRFVGQRRPGSGQVFAVES